MYISYISLHVLICYFITTDRINLFLAINSFQCNGRYSSLTSVLIGQSITFKYKTNEQNIYSLKCLGDGTLTKMKGKYLSNRIGISKMFNSVIRSNCTKQRNSNQYNISRNEIEGEPKTFRRIDNSGNKQIYDRKLFLNRMVEIKEEPFSIAFIMYIYIISKCLAMYYSELCIAVCGLF